MAEGSASTWDEAKVAELKRLWGEGHSASKIAGMLGFASRNMVCGKLHRLGLSKSNHPTAPAEPRAKPARPAPPRREPETRTPPSSGTLQATIPARIPREPPQSVDMGTDTSVTLVSLAELRPGMCRWPVGDPMRPGFGFCGGTALTGAPYCAGHASLAYDTDRYRSSRRLRG